MTLPFILDENNDFTTNLVLAINELNNVTLPKMKVTYQGADSEYHYFLMELAEESKIYSGSFVAKIPLVGKPGNLAVELRPPFYSKEELWENIQANERFGERDYSHGVIDDVKIFGIESKRDPDYEEIDFWPGWPYIDYQSNNFVASVGSRNTFLGNVDLPEGARYTNFRYLGKRVSIKFKPKIKFDTEHSYYQDSTYLFEDGRITAEKEPELYQQILDHFKRVCNEDWSGTTPTSWDLEGVEVLHYQLSGGRKRKNGQLVPGDDEYDHNYFVSWLVLYVPPKGTRPVGIINLVHSSNDGVGRVNGMFNSLDELYLDQTSILDDWDIRQWYYNLKGALGPHRDTNRSSGGYDLVSNIIQGHMFNRLPPIQHYHKHALEVRISRSNLRCGDDVPVLPTDIDELDPLGSYLDEEYVTFLIKPPTNQQLWLFYGFDLNRIFKEEPLNILGERPTKETIIQTIFDQTGLMLPSEAQGLEIKYISQEESGKDYDEYILTSKKGFSTIFLTVDTYCTVRWSEDQ